MEKKFIYDEQTAVVETGKGKVRGYFYDDMYIFKGIPYAKARRFHAPEPVEPWEGVFQAVSYGCVCPLLDLPKPGGELMVPHRFWVMDEDCLNLNIWSPGLDGEKRPVMVWLHGGGFFAGSSIEQIAYEGENMCKLGQVVVVSVNHRLNILGYCDLSPFGEEYANSGNAGTDDLVAALKWIHDNIESFGGDPENVIIFGQSGGGAKVTTLLQTPAADGLYAKGINMSGVIGGALADLGFNLDFAPVADLANVEGSIMEGRAYGTDAGTAAGFVAAMVKGLQEQKVSACLKHFPGIGSSAQDTHNGMASSDRTEEQFRAEELAVFRAGIDAGAQVIMVGHMSAPALTGDNEPCIFSRRLLTDILREEMDYDGVIITDALNMSAVSDYYGADEAAIMAVLAGCDMLLMPEDFEKAYNGILQAVADGNISVERIDDSLRRIYRIKYADMIAE